MKEILKVLEEISATLNKPKVEKRTFTIEEAAEFTGFSHPKIRALIAKPNTDFPFFKVGNKALIDKAMLVMWIEKISTEHRTI